MDALWQQEAIYMLLPLFPVEDTEETGVGNKQATICG